MEPIVTLSKNLDALPPKDRAFAESLLASKTLSVKQHYWIGVLAERATKPAAAPTTVAVGDMTGVLELFATARTHLKFPKVKLSVNGGKPVVLSVAGPTAKAPGTINVTDGGKFGSNVWYGRINTNGTWDVSKATPPETATSLAALLTAFAADPARVASAYGKKFGSCCFCARELTDARSVEVGYGPICAGHYALPWGEAA